MNRDIVRYFVTVKFGSDGMLTVNGNELAISLKSPPERNKANVELVKKLCNHFKVGPDRVRIISGRSSRKKLVEII